MLLLQKQRIQDAQAPTARSCSGTYSAQLPHAQHHFIIISSATLGCLNHRLASQGQSYVRLGAKRRMQPQGCHMWLLKRKAKDAARWSPALSGLLL